MMHFENLFMSVAQAQTTAPASGASAGPGGGALSMFLPMVLVFGIFYLLMIRPQQKQRKQHQALLQNLKKGDEVITTAGIHAKVFAILDNIVSLEVANNVIIKLDKQQVASVKTAPTAS